MPGIGVKSAKRIVAARRHGSLTFDNLKKMGVVLKRAVYFITCRGLLYPSVKVEPDFILRQLLDCLLYTSHRHLRQEMSPVHTEFIMRMEHMNILHSHLKVEHLKL